MNMIASTTLKLMRTNWILVMVALTVLFGLFLYWYLGRYDNLDQVFYSYTLYFNCLLPCVIALMISLYTQYEEQIGHFNHLLQSPISGVIALIVGIIAAYLGAGLFPVACISCGVVFVLELFII